MEENLKNFEPKIKLWLDNGHGSERKEERNLREFWVSTLVW